jgi:hypothetical protein
VVPVLGCGPSGVFFGQPANVTAEITDIAANIAEEQVDQTLRAEVKIVTFIVILPILA